jgi:hypothetical protein
MMFLGIAVAAAVAALACYALGMLIGGFTPAWAGNAIGRAACAT